METVKIGDSRVAVVPQRHARLRRRLSAADFQAIMSGDYGHESYRVLGVLVPDLHKTVPEHEWEGFAREEDWREWRDTGLDPRDDEAADRESDTIGPTTTEIADLFQTAFTVSGASRLGKLVDLLLMTQKQVQPTQTSQTVDLPVSLGESGEST
jgi:hypothetical protein